MIRSNCGSSNHPDPKMFIQVYRLLTAYSLIKPPRGSNVSGSEMLETLLSLEDLEEEDTQKRKELEEKLDLILDGDIYFDEDEFINHDDHAYIQKPIDEEALTIFGGYVSRKLRKFKSVKECSACFHSVCKPASENGKNRESLLDLRTYGGYLKPSQNLYDLIYKVSKNYSEKCANFSYIFRCIILCFLCSLKKIFYRCHPNPCMKIYLLTSWMPLSVHQLLYVK